MTEKVFFSGQKLHRKNVLANNHYLAGFLAKLIGCCKLATPLKRESKKKDFHGFLQNIQSSNVPEANYQQMATENFSIRSSVLLCEAGSTNKCPLRRLQLKEVEGAMCSYMKLLIAGDYF